MILSRLIMNPFGCFSSKEIEFKNNLNVVLGPNEAGKSTMFYAIQTALFTQAKLSKKELKGMRRFFPIGGDTVLVEISFLIKGKPYILRRRWGGHPFEELRLPDGALVSGENEIVKYLDALLPVRQGTFKSILMTYQAGLSKTIDELKSLYPDTIYSLGDILRRVMFETDGVSVDKFKEKVEELYLRYFSHWDMGRGCPEKDRGINNPWQKERGEILEAFYEKEKVKARYEEVKKFYEDFDELNRKIKDLSNSIRIKGDYIEKNRRLRDDIEVRGRLELEIEKIGRRKEELYKVINDWPIKERLVEDLKGRLEELEGKKQILDKEKEEAYKEKENKEIRTKYNRAKNIKIQIDEIFKRISSNKKITKSDFERIKSAFNSYEELKNKILSVNFDVSIDSRKDLEFFIKDGLSDKYSKVLRSGDSFTFKAKGLAELVHNDWEIRISSGDLDMYSLLQELRRAEDYLKGLKEEFGVNTLEEAEKLYEEYKDMNNKYDFLKRNLESELGEYSFELLEQRFKEIGEEKSVKPIEEIVKESESLRYSIKKCREDLERISGILKRYEEEFRTKDELLKMYVNLKNEEERFIERLNSLTPIPEGIKDPDGFKKEYDKMQNEYEEQKNELSKLKGMKSVIEEKAPDESLEEILVSLKDAEYKFKRILKKGNDILKIKEITDEILREIDSGTYSGIEKELALYVSRITNKRYEGVRMDGCLPEGVVRDDDVFLPIDFLSAGTKDMLLLSLKLSMANYFLKGEDGFLLMDDPLVNLDPERQLNASELLREFAKDKQLIIFTCNPHHAELLGGNIINIKYCT